MGGGFQYQGQLDQYLEVWWSPRGSQSVYGFLYEQEKQESIWIEDLTSERAIIRNQALEIGTSTMVVTKLSEKVDGSGDNKGSPLHGGL